MQFITATALLAVAGLATAETVKITGFSAHKTNGEIQSTTFKLQPANVDCSSTAAADLAFPHMTQCGNSLFHFQIQPGEGNNFSVTVTKETGMNKVIDGTADVPTDKSGADLFVAPGAADSIPVELN